MWATLALTAAVSLAPAQGGSLQIGNVRTTYGFLGPTRPDNKLLPGDFYHLAFDIENLKPNAKGALEYSTGMELLDSAGKTQYMSDPKSDQAKRVIIPPLGGNRIAAFANTTIGTDTPPGDYTVKVTVIDRQANATQTLVRKFEVLPKGFGLVRVQLAYTDNHNPQQMINATPLAMVGQNLYLHCDVVGFQRTKTSAMGQQPDLSVEFLVLDESGRPTLPEPSLDAINKGVPEGYALIPITVPIQLNRAGKFTLELKVTDKVARKTAKQSLPIQVLESK